MVIKTEKELANALNNDKDILVIEGNLKDKVFKIEATGKVAWVVAVGSISIAILGILYPVPEPMSQASAKAISGFTAVAATSILGAGATAAAISIAVAGGGVGILKKLRAYKVIENNENSLVLKKR